MNKNIPPPLAILIIVLVVAVIVGVSFWLCPEKETVLPQEETTDWKNCSFDSDCIVFGKDGDCNCGCFNKNYTGWQPEGACFCAAPVSCKCVDGECEGIFEEDETADWQIYKNEEYRFEIKYPQNMVLNFNKGPVIGLWNFSIYDSAVAASVNGSVPGFVITNRLVDSDAALSNKFEESGSILFKVEEETLYVSCIRPDDFKTNSSKGFSLCNQILSTFRFIEKGASTEEIVNQVTGEVLPEGLTKENARYFTDDLDENGKLEVIITAVKRESYLAREGYFCVVTILDKEGNYEKVGELEYEAGYRGIPGVGEVKDINNDNQKEIFLDLGFGGPLLSQKVL